MTTSAQTDDAGCNRMQPSIKKLCVVGFDGRRDSKYLAAIVAAVFITRGFDVILADEVTPTPLTPFLIRKHGASCGVQVTASHNPKDDNGYKVFASNGAQIVPPMDKEIANYIEAESMPWAGVDKVLDHERRDLKYNETLVRRHLLSQLGSDWHQYKVAMTAELGLSGSHFRHSKNKCLTVCYTPMHGVGGMYMVDLMVNYLGYPRDKFVVVKEQYAPDADFPTVGFPNPEEKGALDLALATAKRVCADLVIANDPDADRFAVAEKLRDSNEYRCFSGDEIGAMLGMIAWSSWKAKFGIMALSDEFAFVCSAVSSKFLQKFAESKECRFVETLTGFKWMINTAIQLSEESASQYFGAFCYEEALGYGIPWKIVPDKCGLSAAAAFVAFASSLRAEKDMLMSEWLEAEMKRCGWYFATKNSYLRIEDVQKRAHAFDRFREMYKAVGSTPQSYPITIEGMEIRRVRDLAENFDSKMASGTCENQFPVQDNMLTIELVNGVKMTLRGSGTEPKLKYYSECLSPTSREDASEKLEASVPRLLQVVLGPLAEL